MTAENYATPPGPPVLRNDQTKTDTTQIGLKWTQPLDDGGAPVTQYKIRWKRPSDVNFQDLTPDFDLNVFAHTATDLNGEAIVAMNSYEFQAVAQNRKGWGIPSITVLIIAAKTPDAPINVDFILDQLQIPVSW